MWGIYFSDSPVISRYLRESSPSKKSVLTEKTLDNFMSISMEGWILSFSQFEILCFETFSIFAKST